MRREDQDVIDTTANRPAYHLLVAIAAVFLVVNLTLPGLRGIRSLDALEAALNSVVLSEIALLAIYVTVASEPISRRIGITMMLATVGFLTYATGSYLTPQWVSAWNDDHWQAFFLAAVYPDGRVGEGVSFAVHEVLFLVVSIVAIRVYFLATRRVLCFHDSPPPRVQHFQFSLQHVLLASIFTVIGIRWYSQIFVRYPNLWDFRYVLSRLPLGMLLSVMSAALLVICLEIVFTQRSWRRRFALAIVAILVLSAAGVGILTMLSRAHPGVIRAFLISSRFFACFAAVTLLVLSWAYLHGFRVIARNEFHPPVEQDTRLNGES